jgi:uncharacterized protein
VQPEWPSWHDSNMSTPIMLHIGGLQLPGQLNDSPTAQAIAKLLPLKIRMSRWGDEYYGALPKQLRAAQSSEAREEMAVGELAYWPPGNALCVFFGPTPVSVGAEPRAASPVNPVGKLSGDAAALKRLGTAVEATVSLTQQK